jgi:hypothetical protein
MEILVFPETAAAGRKGPRRKQPDTTIKPSVKRGISSTSAYQNMPTRRYTSSCVSIVKASTNMDSADLFCYRQTVLRNWSICGTEKISTVIFNFGRTAAMIARWM